MQQKARERMSPHFLCPCSMALSHRGGWASNGFSSISALAQGNAAGPFGVGTAQLQGHQQMLVPRASPPAAAPEPRASPWQKMSGCVIKEKRHEDALHRLKRILFMSK